MKFDAVWKFAFPFPTFPRQEQAQFILSGTSLRRSGTKTFLFCFFPIQGRGQGHALWPSRQVLPMCTEG